MQEERTATKPVAVSSAYKTASDRRVVVQGLPCATIIAPRYLTEGHKTTGNNPKSLKKHDKHWTFGSFKEM